MIRYLEQLTNVIKIVKDALKKEVENNTNCEVCANNTKYLDLGNCVSSCPFGFYKDANETKICKCSKNN